MCVRVSEALMVKDLIRPECGLCRGGNLTESRHDRAKQLGGNRDVSHDGDRLITTTEQPLSSILCWLHGVLIAARLDRVQCHLTSMTEIVR